MRLRCFFFLCTLQTFSTLIITKNNVCTTFGGYFFPDFDKNCYYDHDTTLETPDLILKHTGVVEVHPVTTDDGYILTMFRIPSKTQKPAILLYHSIATNSRIFLWQGNNSLAITLWRNGFDVWLTNVRGTSYSDKHLYLTTQDYKYWDFGAHEMGVYDVSTELRHIRNKTNNSPVIFLGHSLGAGVGLIYATMKPEEAKSYLKSMVLVGTPAYFDHATSALTWLKPFLGLLENLTALIRMGSPLSFISTLRRLARIFLPIFPPILFITHLVVYAMCGYTPAEVDPSFYNYNVAMFLDNFSWKTLFHFLQISHHQHRFQLYDYSPKKNMEIYKEETVPKYPLDKISVPIFLAGSRNDTLTTLEDSETLYNDLPAEVKSYGLWKIDGFNHLDYLLGLHRNEIFSNKLIEFLNRIN